MKARRLPLRILLLMASFVLPTMTIQPQAQSADVIDDPEAYAVYASVLPIRVNSGDTPLTNVALLQETRAVTGCPRDDEIQPQWRSVVDSYRKENSRVRILQQGLNVGASYELVTVADLRSLMQEAGYDLTKSSGQLLPGAEVFARFPSGRLYAVSAVGFNPEKTRAILTLQRDCFPLLTAQPLNQQCTRGEQLLMEKQNGRWVRVMGVGGCLWIA